MGRQVDLARLALGRSPFGDLLRDEQGNIFVGPHAQDNTASGYVQAFDYKGRPTNEETERTNRRLYRAQNEVQVVAGVVRKENDGSAPNPFDNLDVDDKIKLAVNECYVGANLGYFIGILCQVSDWWLESWRSRVFVFKSYLQPPVLKTLSVEAQAYGLLPFLFSGLPWAMCAGTFDLLRPWTLFASPPLRRLAQRSENRSSRYELNAPGTASWYFFDLLLFSFEWPLRVFATLQSLHLVPWSAVPSWRSFVPWMVESPIEISNVIGRIIAGDAMGVLAALQSNPFVVAYISDLLRESLISGLHVVLSNCLPQPNEPDELSRVAVARFYSDERELTLGRDRLLGVRIGIEAADSELPSNELVHNFRRHYKGPQTVMGALLSAFPTFFGIVGLFIELDPLAGTGLDAIMLARLHMVYCRRYVHLKRLHHHIVDIDDQQIREEACLQAFDRLGLDVMDLGVDIEWWTSALPLRDYDGFTLTPETLSVIEGVSEIEGPVRSPNEADQATVEDLERPQRERADTAEAADTGGGRHEEAAEAEAAEAEPELPLAPDGEVHESTAGLPMQTLLESIEQDVAAETGPDASSPTARLPPGVRVRRRATDLDEETTDIAVELRPNLLNSRATNMEGLQTYRVTHLSLMSTEVFSILTSSIITAVLMLPLDIYLTRLLVRGFFLSSPTMKGGSAIRWNVWPLSPWAAAKEMGIRGNFRFLSRVVWAFCVQGIMAATMSAGLAAFARWSGRRWFGWGLFSVR